ncbi:hypothetical protein ACQPZP_05160 [Spirillospora sp. CA-142024]|uniref:hypothetical protein n=1 Tax=Spirillospora sp. CA-142024 TaxID=3240036 RepID=UPI003D8CF738
MKPITRSPLFKTVRACLAQVAYALALAALLLWDVQSWQYNSRMETGLHLFLWLFTCVMNLEHWTHRSDRLYHLWDERAKNRSDIWDKVNRGIFTATLISVVIFALLLLLILGVLVQHPAA